MCIECAKTTAVILAAHAGTLKDLAITATAAPKEVPDGSPWGSILEAIHSVAIAISVEVDILLMPGDADEPTDSGKVLH